LEIYFIYEIGLNKNKNMYVLYDLSYTSYFPVFESMYINGLRAK